MMSPTAFLLFTGLEMNAIPTISGFKALAGPGRIIPVWAEFLADTVTPVSAYLKLRSNFGPPCFLLESAEFGKTWGRYSFLGLDPFLSVFIYPDRVEILQNSARRKEPASNPIEALRTLASKIRFVDTSLSFPFQGGLVGFLNYDVVRKWEPLPGLRPYKQGMPEGIFTAPRVVVVFDHLTHKVTIVSQIHLNDTHDLDGEYWRGVETIGGVAEILERPGPLGKAASIEVSPFVPSMEKAGFEEIVHQAKRQIEAGEVIQVVLSQRFSAKARGDAFGLYRSLRGLNPSPYMFYLHFEDIQLVGASPEVLVRCRGSSIRLRPIAGTRPRGGSEQEDKSLERELVDDEKEQAEHVMLVDLGRNDVGRVAEPGSVRLTRFMEVERYSHVMHLVSEIEGRLRSDKDCFDVFMSAFPAGTVTGAPKVRAMEIINELEGSPRGPYAGGVGYFGFDWSMDFCITIRTIVVMGEELWVQAGAGIVYDSIPEREYQETLQKAGALLKAIDQVSGQ